MIVLMELTCLEKNNNTNVTVNTLETANSKTFMNVNMDAYQDLKSLIVKNVGNVIVKSVKVK